MIVESEIKKAGGTVKRVRVGDVFVAEAIKKYNALFAMETSAHYFFPEFYTFDDPIVVSLKLGEILSEWGLKLSEMVDEIPSYPKVMENIPCPDEKKFKVIDELINTYKNSGLPVDLTDGVKVSYSDGWFLLRPSNTTPLIRATVEAKSNDRLQELLKMVKKEIKTALKKIS
jgi:phosphomannomutase